MQRYFIKENYITKDTIEITGSDVHHIKDVMRMEVGDNITCVVDGGEVYLCKIDYISKQSVIAKIVSKQKENNELNGKITIAQGLIRREKTEEVIRRITELGADSYIRVNMMRSIVKANDSKIDRFLTIVKEASEQSHRNKMMKVLNTVSLNELMALKDEYDYCFFADCNEESKDIYSLNASFKDKSVLILIGPEGGFDPKEVNLLKESGFISIKFGNRIMRTETAPLYACSIFSYLMGEKDEN